MTNDTLGLVLSIVGSAVGATWLIRSKMSDLEKALATHVAKSTQQHEALKARVVRLEKRKAR